MCGVFGFAGNLSRSQWRVAHELMVELAVASEERGRDAAGFAALTSQGGLLWQRQPGPAGEFFQGREFARLRRRRVIVAIGHARLATTGAPAVNGNNHPHLAGDWALVHNGFIPRHEQKAALLGLELRSQCDSEILAHVLARSGEEQGPRVCLALGGKQSVLAIDCTSHLLLAWTDGGMPLVAFRVEALDALWWASTERIAGMALHELGLHARFAAADPGVVYRLEVGCGLAVTATTIWEREGHDAQI